MILSVHQPNYIPWIGYFNKIFLSDIFIVFDNVQFVRNSVIQRNKIKEVSGKELLLTVPLKNKKLNINEVLIDNNQEWRKKHWNSIKCSYANSENWNYISNELEKIYLMDWEKISDLNLNIIDLIKNKLEINTKIILLSELKNDFGTKNERIINLCKYFNADTYLSGTGARAYNDEKMFIESNINLIYQKFTPPVYNQKGDNFTPNLSILDLMFNEGEKSKEIVKRSGTL